MADEVKQAVEEDLVDHEVALHPGLHLSNPAIANTVLFISSKGSKIKYRVPTSNQHWTSRNRCLEVLIVDTTIYMAISLQLTTVHEGIQQFVRATAFLLAMITQ